MLNDVIYDAEKAVAEYLQENGARVSAREVGLDLRAGRLYVTEDAIVVQGHTGSLEYYGGFEYVDADYKTQVGEYTIYYADDERVAGCLEIYNDNPQTA